MAYTKQTWNNGDIITAEKLNHIEDGIAEGGGSGGGGVFVVKFTMDYETGKATTDKTLEEIINAGESMPVMGYTEGEAMTLMLMGMGNFSNACTGGLDTGVIVELKAEYGDDDEPTGYWIPTSYTWTVQQVNN